MAAGSVALFRVYVSYNVDPTLVYFLRNILFVLWYYSDMDRRPLIHVSTDCWLNNCCAHLFHNLTTMENNESVYASMRV